MALIDTARTRVAAIATELATALPANAAGAGLRPNYDSYVARLQREYEFWIKQFPELANEGRDTGTRTFEVQSRVE